MPVCSCTASSMGGREVKRLRRGAIASAAPASPPVVQMLILGLRPCTAAAISPAGVKHKGTFVSSVCYTSSQKRHVHAPALQPD